MFAMAVVFPVQGDSEGNVCILACDNIIGYCEKKYSSYKQVSNSDWLPR
jgi:hypothetical protein